jgi:hypothetical protein
VAAGVSCRRPEKRTNVSRGQTPCPSASKKEWRLVADSAGGISSG